MIVIIIIFTLIIIDQLSKFLIVKSIPENESVTVIPKVLNFTSIRNKGAFYGILSGQKSLLLIISFIIISVLSYYLGVYGSLNNNTLRTVSIIFLIAGTSGNFFDRLLRGEVVDFIDFRHNLPIFNIADLYLFFGMITLFISEIIY